MYKEELDEILDIGKGIEDALSRIASGGNSGPTGLEAVTMALCGEGRSWDNNVGSSLRYIGDAIYELAQAIRDSKGA